MYIEHVRLIARERQSCNMLKQEKTV